MAANPNNPGVPPNPGGAGGVPPAGGRPAEAKFTKSVDQRAAEERPAERPGVVDDFVSAYATWADQYEVPRAVHEAYAISLLAAILNRYGIRIDCDGYELPLDLWVAVFAPSGVGKSTARAAGAPLIDELTKIEPVLMNCVDNRDWGSKEALLQQLSGRSTTEGGFESKDNRSSHFYIWDELSAALAKFDTPAFTGMKPWVTKLYDSFELPAAMEYSNTGRSTNTPPIVFDRAPRTNIFALTAESWFFRNLDHSDATGGFVPRWTFVDALGERWMSKTRKPDPKMIPAFVATLQELFEFVQRYASEVAERRVRFFDGFWHVPGGPHDKWYLSTGPRFAETFPELGRTFFNRHRVHVLKLAAVFAASRTRTLQVEPEDWTLAVEKAYELEQTLFRLLKTDMSTEGWTLVKMENAVERAGPEGISRTEFTTIFKHCNDRKRLLETLLEMGVVYVRKAASRGGAPPGYLVHKKFKSDE